MTSSVPIHLIQLQNDFQAYLLDNHLQDTSKAAAFTKKIVNDKKVGVKKRLSIYADAYRLRIIEALASAYPILKALLGDALFDNTARGYIDNYPSTYRNMRWVGDQMAVHLQHTLPQHPIAAEMAQFEWALSLAFDAEDTPILQLEDLAAIAPENWGDIQLKAHPSVQLLALEYNVLLVWQALNEAQTPPAVEKINEPCIVWRKDLGSYYRAIETLEMRASQQILQGISFGELCEFIQTEEHLEADAAMQIAARYLSTWLNDGVLQKE
jgi:hypothetical protein